MLINNKDSANRDGKIRKYQNLFLYVLTRPNNCCKVNGVSQCFIFQRFDVCLYIIFLASWSHLLISYRRLIAKTYIDTNVQYKYIQYQQYEMHQLLCKTSVLEIGKTPFRFMSCPCEQKTTALMRLLICNKI